MLKTQLYEAMSQEMHRLRFSIVAQAQWFTHSTPFENWDSVCADGLLPRPVSACPPEVQKLFSPTGEEILCLHPVGTNLTPTSSGDPPFMTLAVENISLPSRLTLDWSYSWNFVLHRWNNNTDKCFIDFAIAQIKEMGSIASYDKVSPDDLHIRTSGCSADPSGWPKLLSVSDKSVVDLRN